MRSVLLALAGLALAVPAAGAGAGSVHLDTGHLPAYLRDRGEGVALSMFGTYIRKGQLVVYPYFEHYRDANYEYAPNELGFPGDRDYRGDYEANEELLFLAYGLTDRLAVEVEAAVIQAELERAPDDLSGLPEELERSGLGDVEGQLRWRWAQETVSRPEFFGYFETVVPTQPKGSLIGTTDWELKLGSGIARGFRHGTVTVRGAVAYDRAERAIEVGELAVEVLRRVSPSWRVYGGVEGTQDEIELITEAQWHFARGVFLKLNSAVGLTSKATDWAPEVGLLFTR